MWLYYIHKHAQYRAQPEIKTDSEDQVTFLHNKEQLPIYVQGYKKFLTTQEIMNVLLDSELNLKSVCSQVPFAVMSNTVFIVDISKLASAKDILCDDMGSWKWSGSFRDGVQCPVKDLWSFWEKMSLKVGYHPIHTMCGSGTTVCKQVPTWRRWLSS